MRRYKLSPAHAGLIALVAFLCVLPFLLGGYDLSITTFLLINIIIVVSFRLITTMGGWNLAHYPLVGVGAYFSALMAINFGWPFWISVPIAGVVAALIGLGFSYPLVRMTGFAFFIASYAIGEALRLTWVKLVYPFGGPTGITRIPRPSSWSFPGLPTIDFNHFIPYYFIVLGVMMVCLFMMRRVDRSRLGDTFKAIYLQESLSESVGIDITRYKTQAYVIGAFFAGIAGALLAHFLQAIDPSLFGLETTTYLLIWAVLGGTHTFAGPIIGVGVFTGIEEALRPLAAWRPLVYGFILIGVLLFLSGGLEDLPSKVSSGIKKLRSRISWY